MIITHLVRQGGVVHPGQQRFVQRYHNIKLTLILQANQNYSKEAVNVKPSDINEGNNVRWKAEITPNRDRNVHHDKNEHSDPSWNPSDSMMGNRDIVRYLIIVKKDLGHNVIS